jgi:hypothetical protein
MLTLTPRAARIAADGPQAGAKAGRPRRPHSLSPRDAARLVGLPLPAIRDAIEAGDLPTCRADGHRIRVVVAGLVGFVDNRRGGW